MCDRSNAIRQPRPRNLLSAADATEASVLMKWQFAVSERRNFVGQSDFRRIFRSLLPARSDSVCRKQLAFSGALSVSGDRRVRARTRRSANDTSDEFMTVAQQNTNAEPPQVIVSNQEDFFSDFEASYGNQLETFAASYGNEWDALRRFDGGSFRKS